MVLSRLSARTLLILLTCVAVAGSVLMAARRNQATLSTLSLFAPALTVDEEARWDAGWASLCADDRTRPPILPTPQDRPSLWFRALALIDAGEFREALPLFQHLAEAGDDAERAQAYVSAMSMEWEEAIAHYPTPIAARHGRFWGTIAYLAAQRRWFAGDSAGAEPLYRIADGAYDAEGPFTSLVLATCLAAASRPIEAFDGYRRALSVMPPDQAMSHRMAFDRARLDGLEAWHRAVPDDTRVAHWLAYYQQRAAGGSGVNWLSFGDEGLDPPGFYIAAEDVETGPFLWVQSSALGPPSYTLTVNLAPNGAFAWDAPPDGIRPFGWHERMYGGQGTIFFTEDNGKRWLCFDTHVIIGGDGIQSIPRPVTSASRYRQGALVVGEAIRPAIGRMWYVDGEQSYSYSERGHPTQEGLARVGEWVPPIGADRMYLWLLLEQGGRGCVTDVFFVADAGK